MNIVLCPRKWMIVTGLLISGAIAQVGQAGSIFYYQMFFSDPVTQFGSGEDATVLPTITGGYTFSGEFCENDHCSGGAVATPFDSLLRLTNLTLTCGASNCAPIDILFEADAAGENPFPMADFSLGLSGTGTASGFARICISTSQNICSSNLSGTYSANVSFSSSISGSADTFGVPINSGFSVLGDFHLDGLGSGQSVILSNSFDVGAKPTAVGDQIGTPEPSTLLLLPIGFLIVLMLRRGAGTLAC